MALLALATAAPPPALAQVQARFLHTLSNFAGRIPYHFARIVVDPDHNETYVISGNLVRIFNTSGMEVFRFGENLDVGAIVDLAVDGQGDIILLSYKESELRLTRCDFRGVPTGVFEIRNLPDSVPFRPNRMVFRKGRFYFASLPAATVVVTDAFGQFKEHIALLDGADLDEKQRKQKDDAQLSGFSLDEEGNMFFTVAIYFRAFKLTTDRKLTSFGRPGSAPGRFGITAGIATDRRGRVFVADKLKSAVAVFDRDFNFLTEFGYYGEKPDNLIVPDDIAVDNDGRLYVAQGRTKGISVFALGGD